MNSPSAARDRAIDLLCLVFLVLAVYGVRLGDLSIRGEESRWATVAREMKQSGDWIVPRQQGEPFLSRPPMGSWLIALAAEVRGRLDPWAVRLPSLLAVLVTTFLIHSYARSFLGRIGSLTAALGFVTMPEILQMGRLAESDIVFTAFLGGGLLAWHWGHSTGRRMAIIWPLAYALIGAATLTKGPQAPVYFAATVGLYLLASRQWRALLTGSHLLGLAVYALVVGAWMGPYYLQMGWSDTWRILTGDSTDRFVRLSMTDVAMHLAKYPVELIGCTAPWSYLLVAFASQRFRASLGTIAPHARFLLIALLVSFPTCWITPGGQTRYMMPLYPCLAVLAGMVVERLAWPTAWLEGTFRVVRVFAVLALGGLAISPMIVSVFPEVELFNSWRQSWPMVAVMTIGGVMGCGLFWLRGPFSTRRTTTGIWAGAGMMALLYAGPVIDHLERTGNHPEFAVAKVRQRLPSSEPLVSVGPVPHLFAYHFDRPITPIGVRPSETAMIPSGGWFCFTSAYGIEPAMPFEFERIAAISVDRSHSRQPKVQVIIARRTGRPSDPKQMARRSTRGG